MSRCPKCFGLNDDAGYSHLCHTCLATLEPTPQDSLKEAAPPEHINSPANTSRSAVVGLDPVARLIPVLLPDCSVPIVWARTWEEYSAESSKNNPYRCGEEAPLYSAADVARLQSELAEWRGQAHRSQSDADRLQAERDIWIESAKEFCNGMEYYRDQIDKAARHIGLPCFTADDGGVHEEPLRAKVAEAVATLVAENEEQARLLGISGSRETKLLAELERVAGDLNKLRARVESVLWPNSGMAHVTMKGE